MKAAAVAPLPAWRRDEREPRTDISQVELQLHGLRDAPRRGLHQLRREDRGADPRVRPQRARHRAMLGCLPRSDRTVLLHAARALARAASAVAVGATVTAVMPPHAVGEAASAFKSRWALSNARARQAPCLRPSLRTQRGHGSSRDGLELS